MALCPTCNQTIDDTARFCPHDGTPLTETAASPSGVATTPGPAAGIPDLPLPVVVGARYRLEVFRGGGGMARVYKAVDVTLERPVAVKIINPTLRNDSEFDARFQREARIASQLQDPHIIVVHDFGLDTDYGPFLVMEYLEGMSLREYLVAHGPMPLKAVLQMANGLLLALIHAHGRGIVHRDIKPDNIFLLNVSGVKQHVRVLDFGIARIYRGDDPQDAVTLTHDGVVLGTPRYMSPEQLAGRPVDARSDLYSMALVLHEALTGELPYGGGKRLCEIVPEAGQPLQQLLEECLQQNPDHRPRTALEVYLRLQDLSKASGILLLPPGMLDRLTASRMAEDPTELYRPPHRRRLLLSTAGILMAMLLGLGVWWAWPQSDNDGTATLLGVRLGQSPEAVAARIPFSRISKGDPWKSADSIPLGGVLQPSDLGTDPEGVTARWDHDGPTCGIFVQDRLMALITSHKRAQTQRGIGIGSTYNQLIDRYPEDHHTNTAQIEGVRVDVLRFDSLGLGFEIRGKTITRITLFPPAS
jgi:serine/threonine protein kinase